MANSIIKVIEKGGAKYRLLDYIESTGTQYINTGIKRATNSKYDFAFQIDSISTKNYTNIWGCDERERSLNDKFYLYTRNASATRKMKLGTKTSYEQINIDFATNTKYHFEIKDNKCYINNTEYTNIQWTNANYADCIFWTRIQSTSGQDCLHGRFYYYKTWKGSELLLDLIPVERVSDNVLGMLDLVSGTFLTNQGTGTFIKGNYIIVEHIYKTHKVVESGVEKIVDEVEYIEKTTMTANPYIKLDVVVNQNTEFEYDVMPISPVPASWGGTIFGHQNLSIWNNSNAIILNFGSGTIKKNVSYIQNVRTLFSLKNKTFKINNESVDSSSLTFSANGIRLLGTENYADGITWKQKLYGFKLWLEGTLKFNMIPVKVRTTNEYCLLDLVENKLYHNAGTGAFTGGNKVEVQKITQAYFHNNTKYYPLDYIQSSGTQYIITNIRPNGDERFEFDFTPLEWSSSTNNTVCGARRGANGLMVFGSILDVYGGGSQLANFTYNANINKMTLNVKHKVRYERDKMWYDGTLYTATGRQLIDVGYNMTLFASSNDGTIAGHTKMKLHKFIVYNQDLTEKEHWLPMQRASDNVLGLLDIISGEFKVNSGTGTFTGNKREITF